MRKYALTILGRDHVGIAAGVAKVLFDIGFNLEDTSMVKLQNEFAMIVIVSGPVVMSDQSLKEAFDRQLEGFDLGVMVRDITNDTAQESKETSTHILSVIGADQPGIVYHVTRFLADNGVNIVDVESAKINESYVLMVEAEVPAGTDMAVMEGQLAAMGKQINTRITIQESEKESL